MEALLREAQADYLDAHVRHFEEHDGSALDLLLDLAAFYVSDGRDAHPLFMQVWGYAAADADARALVRRLYGAVAEAVYQVVKTANPALDDTKARRAVLHIFSLEEGLKLFFGLGGDEYGAHLTAEEDIRAFARRLVFDGADGPPGWSAAASEKG